MSLRRKIVTVLTAFGILTGLTACEANKPDSEKTEFIANASNQELRSESLSKMREAKSIQTELMAKYKLFIASEPKLYNNEPIHTSDFGKNYDFSALTVAERLDVRRLLDRYLTLVDRILAIDATINITGELHDQVMTSQESATAFKAKLDQFEQVYGKNYKPGASTTPARTIDI